MLPSCQVIDLGLKPYQEVLKLQEFLFEKNLAAKANNKPTKNTLILCEHYPVYTLGKSGKRENILVTDEELNAEYYHVSRGGDVTFHGPGQLVVYPIFDIDSFAISLAEYISRLEETIIESLKEYGLQGERIKGAAGIWLKGVANEHTLDRKICAIGVRASRHITMHGLAININTDLTYFNKIVPCGLQGKGVTSLQKELGKEMNMGNYKAVFLLAFEKVFAAVACSASLP
jgi:lipoyl(octanoyl) transferase